jgi:hypothetical protein
MNPTSVRWAFNAGRQHCENSGQLLVLLMVANGVTRDHRGCVLSAAQIADATHLDVGEVEEHLGSLERIGLIYRGDQSLVENYADARRPTVWDLAFADGSGPFVRGRTTQDPPTAVYRFFDAAGRLLYVGITMDRDVRWSAHKSKPWWPEVTRKTVAWYETEREARKAERQAIASENPVYNLGESASIPGNGYRVDLLSPDELADIRRERRSQA